MCGRNASRARRRHSGRVFPLTSNPAVRPTDRAPGRHTGRTRRMAWPRVVALRLSAGFQPWTFAGFQKWTVCFGEDSGIGFRERSSGAPTPAPLPPPEPPPESASPPAGAASSYQSHCCRGRFARASGWPTSARPRSGLGLGVALPAAWRAPRGCTNRARRHAALAARLAPAPGAQSSPRRSALRDSAREIVLLSAPPTAPWCRPEPEAFRSVKLAPFRTISRSSPDRPPRTGIVGAAPDGATGSEGKLKARKRLVNRTNGTIAMPYIDCVKYRLIVCTGTSIDAMTNTYLVRRHRAPPPLDPAGHNTV